MPKNPESLQAIAPTSAPEAMGRAIGLVLEAIALPTKPDASRSKLSPALDLPLTSLVTEPLELEQPVALQ